MKRFMLLFILVLAVAAFGQDAMDAPAEEMTADTAMVDTMAMDEMLMTDTTAVAEEAMEDSGDAMEAMLAAEGTSSEVQLGGAAQIGYTVGLDVGYPAYRYGGLGTSFDESGLTLGITVNTPFGATVGPFEIGFGVQVGTFGFGHATDQNKDLSGIYALATANTALLETTQGAVSAQVGAGYYGASLGLTAGAAFDYAVPNMPIVLRPYVRANATLDSGVETSGDDSGSYLWFNVGAMVSYDISTLF